MLYIVQIVAFLYLTSFDTVWHTVLVSVPPPPPPPPNNNNKKYQIYILCQNSHTRKLNIKVIEFVLKTPCYQNLCALCHTIPPDKDPFKDNFEIVFFRIQYLF